jgi:DNA-binding MarR family transcriptional regulator
MVATDNNASRTEQPVSREALQEEFFKILHHQARMNQKLTGLILEQVNLTFPQWAVLINLHEQGGSSTMQHLAQNMRQTGGGMTSLVDKLVKAGLATRENVPEDRRIVRVVITPEGKERIRELHKRFIEEQTAFCSILDDDELAQYIRTLQKLSHVMENSLEKLRNESKTNKDPQSP